MCLCSLCLLALLTCSPRTLQQLLHRHHSTHIFFCCQRCCCCAPRQVIFPLDFEKTEQSERFMKTVEAIIKERPDCIGSHAARDIPSPALGQSLAGVCGQTRLQLLQ
jgi:hypothetical protein